MIHVVYFSNVTRNTARFADRLAERTGQPGTRIPVTGTSMEPITVPFVLLTPTYGDSTPHSLIPRQVTRFLRHEPHLDLLQGVVSTGNMAFGADYARAGHLIAERHNVPLLHTFELSGTRRDLDTFIERTENL